MLIILILATLLFVYWIQMLVQRSKMPPGPFPFPILGNMLQLGSAIGKYGGMVGALKHFKEVYGPSFTLWMGPMATVHLAESQLAQEIMIGQGAKCADRFTPLTVEMMRDFRGIVAINGGMWVEQRRFMLHTLRNFGLGRNIMEQRIMAEYELRVATLDEMLLKGDNVVEAGNFFALLVGSIINRMLLSERFTKIDEEEFFRLKKEIDDVMDNLSIIDIYMKKWLLNVPFFRNRYEKERAPVDKLKAFLRAQVRERISSIESGIHMIEGEGEDYVDAFILKMWENEENPETSFDEVSLIMNLVDLWIAGQETTSSTFCWGCFHLLNNPECLQLLREEIWSVTKKERRLSLRDKPLTPYLNATIVEIHRLTAIVNVNLWRKTSEDINFRGYTVDKGTPISAQLCLLFNDEKHFPNPEKFDPSRYLNEPKLEQLIVPFGVGKRACLGESLARAELYLILGNLLQDYELLPHGEPPSTRPSNPNSLINRPTAFTMIVNKLK